MTVSVMNVCNPVTLTQGQQTQGDALCNHNLVSQATYFIIQLNKGHLRSLTVGICSTISLK